MWLEDQQHLLQLNLPSLKPSTQVHEHFITSTSALSSENFPYLLSFMTTPEWSYVA